MKQQFDDDNFLAETEVMDLSALRDKTFCVAAALGNPNGIKFACGTIHGPYDFTEMCQEVGEMWREHQHHARVVILDKDPKAAVQCLDGNTIDYIEAHYVDIILEETLANAPEDREFTCEAGTVVEDEEGNVSKV